MREEVMKCESCSAQIEYRFLKNCTYCDNEIVQTESSQDEFISTLQWLEPVKKKSKWVKGVINVGYVLVSSIAGMISGAVAIYALAVLTYPLFFRPSGDAGLDCSRGTFIGFLCIVVGAYLGTVGGSVFAVKSPPFRATK